MASRPAGGKARAGRGRAQTAAKPTGPVPAAAPAPVPVPVQAQSGPSRPPAQQAWPRMYAPTEAADVTQLAADMKKIAIQKEGNGNGNGGNGNGGNGAKDATRGGIRSGRRIVEEVVHTRPKTAVTKTGTTGERVQLIANYFEVLTKPDWVLYQYCVDYSCAEDRIMVKRAWLNQHKQRLGKFIFDGAMLWSSAVYCRNNEALELVSKSLDGQIITLKIRLTTTLDKGNPAYLMVYNLLLRRCMGKLDLELVQRNLFDPKAKTDILEHKLSVWPGYLTSIRQHENSVLMCCELLSKVLRIDTVLDVFRSCVNTRDPKNEFTRQVIGQVVLTPYNNKTYTIDDILWNANPTHTFETKNGPISYKEYFSKYKQQGIINDLRQPLLLSKPRAKDKKFQKNDDVILVPELCQMTGLNDEKRKNFHLMKALANVTHIAPKPRVEKLRAFNKRLLGHPEVDAELQGWQMKISQDLVRVPGRVLPAVNIIMGGGVKLPPSADWTRTSVDKPMYEVAPLKTWVTVVPKFLINDTQQFIRTMRQVAGKLRFNIPEPTMYEASNDSVVELSRAVDAIVARMPEIDLIWFSLASVNADRYSAIKKKCVVDRAVNSQVVTKRSLTSRNLLTIATKVAIQINTKLGGSPWTVGLPKTNAMICGFDVCHDAVDKSNSVGAFVATANEMMTAWTSSVRLHKLGQELSDHISVAVTQAVRRWVDVNQRKPGRIIIYRDGVGDGQISHVRQHEVENVRKVLQELYGGEQVLLTYIIVTKRINTRLMRQDMNNPLPGTIVDDVITQPEKYDFYLISQTASQGTVSPTAYNIIYDESGWPADNLQRLTFMSTHLYYNISSTVRVPAPVQYAHKLAFLVSQSLHREPNVTIQDRLYFI